MTAKPRHPARTLLIAATLIAVHVLAWHANDLLGLIGVAS